MLIVPRLISSLNIACVKTSASVFSMTNTSNSDNTSHKKNHCVQSIDQYTKYFLFLRIFFNYDSSIKIMFLYLELYNCTNFSIISKLPKKWFIIRCKSIMY